MYNRYVPRENGHVRIRVEESPPEERREDSLDGHQYTPPPSGAQGQGGEREENFHSLLHGEGRQDPGRSGDKSGGLKSLLKALKLEDTDSGDILLFLIILLLLTDGDDLDLVITLGLMLLLGLGDKKNPDGGGLSGLLKFL